MDTNFFKPFISQFAELDELLFLSRNKSYGAYMLRKKYPRNMTIGLAVSILLFLLFLILPSIRWNNYSDEYKMTEVVLENPPELLMPNLPSKPTTIKSQTEEVIPKIKKQIKTGDKPKVVKEDKIEPVQENEPTKKESLQPADSVSAAKDDSKGGGTMQGDGEFPFNLVEVMPQFPGGSRALTRFISSKLMYPESARKNKIEGTVIIGFVIDEYGRLRNPKIVKSLYPACDEEALRVIRLTPDWVPAKSKGRNVSVNFTIPVEFKSIH